MVVEVMVTVMVVVVEVMATVTFVIIFQTRQPSCCYQRWSWTVAWRRAITRRAPRRMHYHFPLAATCPRTAADATEKATTEHAVVSQACYYGDAPEEGDAGGSFEASNGGSSGGDSYAAPRQQQLLPLGGGRG
eukprot:242269-Chlamydomonas_euryale.AAC.1